MIRALFLGSALLALTAGSAGAQALPFDMSPEAPRPPARPSTPTPPTPAAPPAPPAPNVRPAEPAPAASAPAATPAPSAAPTAAAPVSSGPADGRRYLLPMERLTLAGETAQRRWAIFLSEGEAAAGGTLNIGYLNSILVAPEASRLRVVVNGQVAIETPVQAVNEPATIAVDLPDGLLRPGLNTIAFETSLRHRTDCTVQSTYDLWTELEGAGNYIAFGDEAGEERDLRAVGFDSAGGTNFSIVVPAGALNEAAPHTIRLTQGLTLLAGAPNPKVAVSQDLGEPGGPGTATVLLGPADDIRALAGDLPAQAARDPYAGFETLADGREVFLVTGPSWSAVAQAVESVVAPVDRPTSLTRTSLSEPGWRSPDAPLLFAGATLRFRDLGVASQEFDGRLFRTSFAVALPADFYAEAYGEANLVLDAAYSAAVLPSSRLDVYVNGDIATTIPIGSRGGGVLRAYPVPVTLRHFRPGVNTVTIEAILDTQADAACLPGTAAEGGTRFALFDTSAFQMPNFARISRRPDLAALSGVGFPYNRVEGSIPLALGETSPDTVSAAATFVSRLALVAGRPMDFEIATPAAAGGRDAIFVGAAPRLASGVLAQAGVSDLAQGSWGGSEQTFAAPPSEISLAEWEASVGSSWEQPFVALETWLSDRFDLTGEELRLTPMREEPYAPPPEVPFLVAQGPAPDGLHSWTVVTAPDGEALAAGAARMTREESWSEMAGRLTAYDAQQALNISLPANDALLVPTVPFSLANMRLVAANWLSAHALAYALVLAIASIVLGVASGAMAGRSGRE